MRFISVQTGSVSGKKNIASLRACCNAYCTPDSVPMINSLSGLSFANCMMPLVEPM